MTFNLPGIPTYEEQIQNAKANMPTLLADSDINHLRYEMIRERFGTRFPYPEFLEGLMTNYPDHTFVFIDRDARPFYVMMEIFREEDNRDITNRIIGFTRSMIPPSLTVRIQDCKASNLTPERKYEALVDIIENYVRRNGHKDHRIHRYFRQELQGEGEMLFVDTGFWATCVNYLSLFFYNDTNHQIIYLGPEGSNKIVQGYDENDALRFEDSVKHGFEIEGLIESDGRFELRKTQHSPFYAKEMITDYIAIEMVALEHLFGTVPDKRVKKLIDKYINS
jgi:hypothetical protein